MKEILKGLARAEATGEPAVLATIIRQEGSSPRGAGTKLVAFRDGTFEGTIGGGEVEARALEKAQDVFRSGHPERIFVSMHGRDEAESEMLCGGEVEIFLEPVPAGGNIHRDIFKKAHDSYEAGGFVVLLTFLDSGLWDKDNVPRFLIGQDGEVEGPSSSGEVYEAALPASMEKLSRCSKPCLITIQAEGGRRFELFAEPIKRENRLFIFGAGHVSRKVAYLASMVGFDCSVIDDRDDFADPGFFPEGSSVWCMPYDGALSDLCIEKGDFIVILTRGHLGDKKVLAQALGTDASYIGMIGSTRKRDEIYERLLEEGFSEKELELVHCPIGLEIGAETPDEIAVSIVAELIGQRARIDLRD